MSLTQIGDNTRLKNKQNQPAITVTNCMISSVVWKLIRKARTAIAKLIKHNVDIAIYKDPTHYSESCFYYGLIGNFGINVQHQQPTDMIGYCFKTLASQNISKTIDNPVTLCQSNSS
jgi:hypothetical protein